MNDSGHDGETINERLQHIEQRLIAEDPRDAKLTRAALREQMRHHRRMTILQAVIGLAAVIALIIVVIGSTFGQQQLDLQQQRTCDVVSAKLQTDVALRNTTLESARENLKAGRSYLGDIHSLVHFIKQIPRRQRTAGLRVFAKYFHDSAALQRANNLALDSAVANSNQAVARWSRLQARLACHS